MAVVEAESIIKLIKDNNLLSSSYNENNLANNLNTPFYTINFATASELVSLIPKLTTGKIKNKSDLSALTLSIEEINTRINLYKSFDENITLKNISDLKYDPNFVIEKIKYCKMYNYPYANEDGVLFDEVIQELKSASYLRRFYNLYKEKYNPEKGEDYSYILENVEEDKISSFFAIIQNISYKYFDKLCFISQNFEDYITPLIENEETDLNVLAYTSFAKLQIDNPFIDINLINNNYNFNKNDFIDDRRNGQR